jgi:hypothetical protein
MHPEYCERNRKATKQRRRQRAAGKFAKMDASTPVLPVASGTYRLVPAAAGEFAKMDASIVEITLLSKAYPQNEEVCKETT